LVNDNNALTDASVNGVGLSSLDGTTVYVYLIDSTRKALFKTTVGGGGIFSIPTTDVYSGYKLVASILNINPYDQVPLTGNNPPDWGFTGEDFGSNNSAGTGVEPGSADGLVQVNTSNLNINNLKIGIERLPDSDNKLYFISTPKPDTLITLNGTGLLPGPLTGADPEDGILGGTNKVHITTLPTNNNELYYNGSKISKGQDGINPPSNTNPFTINSYNSGLLQMKFTRKFIFRIYLCLFGCS
jgi:hypothetical protein